MSSIDARIYEYMKSQLDEKSLVVDIGAYTGKISNSMLSSINGNPEKFHLIEPCPSNYGILTDRCKGCNNHNLAISDEDGSIDFFVANHKKIEGSSQSNSLFKKFIHNRDWATSEETIKVKTLTLDSFIKENSIDCIDFLKINCEGGEFKIFNSSLDFLSNTKYIYLHLHGKNPLFLTPDMTSKKKEINAHLLSNGYSLVMGDKTADIPKIKKHIHQLWEKK